MSTDKNKYHSRAFLNSKKPGLAAIECVYQIEDNYHYGEITISDCHGSINLDISCDNKEEHINSLLKVDILITELERCRKWLVDNNSYFEENESTKL